MKPEFRITGRSITPGSQINRPGVDEGRLRLVSLWRDPVDRTTGVIVIHCQSRRSLHGMHGMGTTYEAAHMMALPFDGFKEIPNGWQCGAPLWGAEFSSRGWAKQEVK